jgi:hypothetical protein
VMARSGPLALLVVVLVAGCKDGSREQPGDAAPAGDAAQGRDCTGSVGMGSDCDRFSGQVCYRGGCEYVCDVFGIVGGTLCNQHASGGGTVECCRPDQQCCPAGRVDMYECQPAGEPCPTACGVYSQCRESQWCAVAYDPASWPQTDTCRASLNYPLACVDSCPASQQCGRECCGANARCTGTCCAPLWPDGGVGDAGPLDGAAD